MRRRVRLPHPTHQDEPRALKVHRTPRTEHGLPDPRTDQGRFRDTATLASGHAGLAPRPERPRRTPRATSTARDLSCGPSTASTTPNGAHGGARGARSHPSHRQTSMHRISSIHDGAARHLRSIGQPGAPADRPVARPAHPRSSCSRDDDDGVCACDLESFLDLSQPTVSHPMKPLVDAGLVHGECRGPWVYYELATATLRWGSTALDDLARDAAARTAKVPA